MSKEVNQNQNNPKEEKVFFFLLLIMIASILISFVNARGASDVDFFIGWLDNAQKSVEKVIEWREKNEDL